MIRPLGNRILILPESIEEISSPIHVVQVKREMFTGEAIAVGPHVELVKRGDIVHFGRLAGHKVRHGDNDYVMILENEVLAYERSDPS